MKKIINEEGFKKAMEEGKTWTTLDCQLSETEENSWYFEIEKTIFHDKDGTTEQLAFGDDDDSLEVVGKIWENFIEKYSPDEYFVDQHNLTEPTGPWAPQDDYI